MRQYDLDEESHFEVKCVPNLCTVSKSDEGMDVHELFASLPPSLIRQSNDNLVNQHLRI